MKAPLFRPTTQCDIRLDFQPLGSWPDALPGVALQGFIIAGFDRPMVLSYEGSSEELLGTFVSVHPHLSFAELSRLTATLSNVKDAPFATPDLLKKYAVRHQDEFAQVSHELLKAPTEFQVWAGEKSVTAGDLAPLIMQSHLTGPQLDLMNRAMREIPIRRLSKQEGLRALELLLELALMGLVSQVEEVLTTASKSNQEWIEKLQLLRMPKVGSQDRSAKEWIDTQVWPKPAQIRWHRQGDKSGLEIRFWVNQLEDLNSTRQSLETIESRIHEAAERLWPKH